MDLPAEPAAIEVVEGLPFPLSRATLPNGLEVWVQPRPDATSTTAYLVLRAGGRYEDATTSGASHLLEHMFETPRWSEAEGRALVDRAGGRKNGLTVPARVAFWIQVPREHTDLALDWLAETAFRPTLPGDQLAKERDVVFEEREGREGWRLRAARGLGFGLPLGREIRRALYPGSPRGQDVLGEDASLDAIGIDTLRAFHRRFYVARNAALIVVGPTAPDALLPRVAALFADVPAGERATLPDDPPPVPLGGTYPLRSLAVHDRCTVVLAARGPALGHADQWAAEVLLHYLRTGLGDDLRGARGLTYGVRAGNVAQVGGGELRLESETDCSNVETVTTAFTTAVDAVRGGAVDADRLERARRGVHGRWTLETEDNLVRAGWLSEWFTLDDDRFAGAARHEAVLRVGEADVVRVAAAWLAPDARGVWVSRPLLTSQEGWIAAGVVALLGALIGGVWSARRRGAPRAPRVITGPRRAPPS